MSEAASVGAWPAKRTAIETRFCFLVNANILGRTSPDLDASLDAWEFFSHFSTALHSR
ncbi:hypothetical protein ACN28E_24395 [Archangium lansingense]|uniref:hypothetical protein n=1 Tax=Archangium lansingense TaxID=2995310 RepID=UPI003B7DD2C6